MIKIFEEYYKKAKLMQGFKYQNIFTTKEEVNDELIWNIPIYDVVNRRYAAFSSFPEAVYYKLSDPKGNGKYFINSNPTKKDFAYMCYLFRLCGSGINYKPKVNEPFNTHGFGNFWIVDKLANGIDDSNSWLNCIPNNLFCDVKGYLLPMIKKGLRNFILEDSKDLFEHLWTQINTNNKISIKELTDIGNQHLLSKGFKRQNFVLTAFSMDMAEYFNIDKDGDVYVGSNAKKCLKLILPNIKNENKALRYLCDITHNFSKPYDMEDVACDFIRYINNFQSSHHINNNNGITYKNNIQ
jgi:hypothetical protein